MISCWNDLRKYGFEYLTGEADALGYRGLVDLNAQGKEILCGFLGVHDLVCEPNRNSSVNGQPAICAVMLAHDLILPLGIYALFHTQQADIVVVIDDHIEAYSRDEWENPENDHFLSERRHRGRVLYRPGYFNNEQPRVGFANVHAMSGRVMPG